MNYKDKEMNSITTSSSTDYKCYYSPYIGDPPPGTYPIITDPLPVYPNITPLTYGTCLCNSCLWKDSWACPRVYSNISNTGISSNKTITMPCEAPKSAKGSKSRQRDGEGKSPAERSEASIPEPPISEPFNKISNDNIHLFRKLAAALASQYQRKNEAYGDSFGKSVNKYGVISALTRMSDKWNRLESLLIDGNKNGVKDESVDDTLLDLATYCIMTVLATRSDYEIDRIVEKLEGK